MVPTLPSSPVSPLPSSPVSPAVGGEPRSEHFSANLFDRVPRFPKNKRLSPPLLRLGTPHLGARVPCRRGDDADARVRGPSSPRDWYRRRPVGRDAPAARPPRRENPAASPVNMLHSRRAPGGRGVDAWDHPARPSHGALDRERGELHRVQRHRHVQPGEAAAVDVCSHRSNPPPEMNEVPRDGWPPLVAPAAHFISASVVQHGWFLRFPT